MIKNRVQQLHFLSVGEVFQKLLPIYFNIFEKLLCNQQAKFFWQLLSKLHCGFNKGNGTQSYLLLLIKIWKGATDKNKTI